jgi:hypothetical protein
MVILPIDCADVGLSLPLVAVHDVERVRMLPSTLLGGAGNDDARSGGPGARDQLSIKGKGDESCPQEQEKGHAKPEELALSTSIGGMVHDIGCSDSGSATLDAFPIRRVYRGFGRAACVKYNQPTPSRSASRKGKSNAPIFGTNQALA